MIRVIGLGSPFGDDSVGWRVIELLRGHLPVDADLVAVDRPGATLIQWLPGVHHLIIVDALQSGAEPGSVVRVGPSDLATPPGGLSGHGLSLADTFQLASRLGCLPARIEIYGVEIESCEGEHLSTVAQMAAAKLARQVGHTLI